jgi:hypothetical protein
MSRSTGTCESDPTRSIHTEHDILQPLDVGEHALLTTEICIVNEKACKMHT